MQRVLKFLRERGCEVGIVEEESRGESKSVKERFIYYNVIDVFLQYLLLIV